MESIMEATLKAKHRSAISPSNITPRDAPKGIRLKLLQSHLHTYVYCSIVYNNQALERDKMHHNWQIDQENVVFIHNVILLSHKEEWNFVISK
jgi:hypothetical protein